MQDIPENPQQLLKDCLFCGQAIKVSSHKCPHCGKFLAKLEQQNWKHGGTAYVPRVSPAGSSNVDKYRAALAFCLFLALILMVLILIPRPDPLSITETAAKDTTYEPHGQYPESVDSLQKTEHPFPAAEQSKFAASDATNNIFIDGTDQFFPVALIAESSGFERQEKEDRRLKRIEYLTAEILEDMRKKGAVTADTLFLKSGEQIDCAILDESVSHYSISHKGLATTLPKEKVIQIERRSKESVEEKLHKTALAKATNVVDNRLVRYGDEWILPEERAHRIRNAKKRLNAKRIDARKEIETAKAEVIAEAKAIAKADLAELAEGTEVPVAVSCRSIFVKVTFVANGKSVDAMMLLDTGASITCIHPCIAEKLGLVYSGRVQLMLADGREGYYPRATLEEVAVQGLAVRELEACVAPFGPRYGHGLLGADFLNHFEYGFAPGRNVLVLKPLGSG